MTAECELRLQRKEEEAIQFVRNELVAPSADQVLEMGEKHNSGQRAPQVQVLVLYDISHRIYSEHRPEYDPVVTATWMKRFITNVRSAAYNVACETCDISKSIAVKYGAKPAEIILQTLNEAEMLTQSTAKERAVFTYKVAEIYFRAKHYKASLPLLKKASKIFQSLTDVNMYDHELYCIVLITIGNCYFRLCDFTEARRLYEKTMVELKKQPTTSEKWLRIVEADWRKTFSDEQVKL